MKEITLTIPRWFYPNNLGDSVVCTFIPKVIKKKYPYCKLTVITHGDLLDVLSEDPLVDVCRGPLTQREVGSPQIWMSGKYLQENEYAVYPEWHYSVWTYWNDNFEFFAAHPTANILTVNVLLQLGMTEYLFDGTDLRPSIPVGRCRVASDKCLGIVPATKLSGKPTPHPGCNGKGMRFNGDEGESWKRFVKRFRELCPDVEVFEFSDTSLGFGDTYVPPMSWKATAAWCKKMTVSVMNDGGMHHIFNSQSAPVVLTGSWQISKAEHVALSNATMYPDLYEECAYECGSNIRSLRSWKDIEKTCTGACEKISPEKLAEYVARDFF